jgi:hypothetical protein
MINRYTQFTPLTFDLEKPNVQLNATLLEGLQKRHDENFKIAEELKNQLINSLPQDRLRANELQQGYAKRVDNIVQAYNGDYSQATKDLYSLASQIKRDFSPGGEAHAINKNYTEYVDWSTRSKDRVAKGEITSADYNMGNKFFLGNFQGTKADENGIYSNITLQELAKTVDLDKIVRDVADKMKPEKIETGSTVFKNGLKIDITDVQEGVSYERLQPSIQLALKGNPEVGAYIAQKAMFTGLDPALATNYLDEYAQSRAQDLSYLSSKYTEYSDRDKFALQKYSEDRADERKKMELFGTRGMFEYIPVAGTLYEELSPTIIQTLSDETTIWQKLSNTGIVGARRAMTKSNALPRDTKSNLQQLVNDSDALARNKINGTLLQSNMQEVINSLDDDPVKARQIFNAKYGKDAKWTTGFDKQVFTMYNKDFKNNSFTEPQVMPIGGKQGEAIIEDLFSALNTRPDQVKVSELGSSRLMSAKDAEITGDDLLVTINGKKSTLTTDVNYIMPQPNVARGGIMVVKDGKTYIVEDQSEERRKISRDLGESYMRITSGNQTRSDIPIQIGQGPNGIIYGLPEIVYERGSDKVKRSYFRYALIDPATGQTIKDSKGEEITYKPNSPMDILRQYSSYDDIINPGKKK